MVSRRTFTASALALAGAAVLPRRARPAAFEASWDSLIEGYRTPEWFGDAKLGIWAH